MKQILLAACATLLALSALAAEQLPPVMRLGIILPLSGDAATTGEAIKNGITLGYEKLDPAVRNRLQLIWEDDHGDPKATVSAFNKLLSSQKIDLLLTTYSGTSKAVAPLAEQRRIPQVAIATDPEIVRGMRYVVNFWVTPEEEAKVLLPEALRRGYKQIARISAIHQGAIACKRAFDRENEGRIKLALDEEYPASAKDFRPFLNRLRTRPGLDAILVILMNGQCGVFARQARELGIQLPLFNFEVFEDAAELKLSRGALAGAWYVNADDPPQAFFDEYRRRFPGASFFAAANGHDALQLLGSAVAQAAGSEEVNHFLHTVRDFPGALGTFSATGDNRFSLPAAIKEVTSEGFRRLGPAPAKK